MNHYSGSCKCGEIQFQLTGDIKKVVNCHCNQCRKMNSMPVSTYGVVLENEFALTTGELSAFTLKENAVKHFCGHCGTAIYNKNPRLPGLALVYLYSLDSDHLPEPQVNVFCESKLNWLDNLGEIPNFEQHMS
ncbi:GFA family protein [Vibrio rhizosphaerae]|uniref:GFA family protein n=1 Tax=Vibrio rhizosphaerae TaxID=398736 RepID=UPI0005703D4F|nr:GFA family protein [Vibrio rhizosphaerae]